MLLFEAKQRQRFTGWILLEKSIRKGENDFWTSQNHHSSLACFWSVYLAAMDAMIEFLVIRQRKTYCGHSSIFEVCQSLVQRRTTLVDRATSVTNVAVSFKYLQCLYTSRNDDVSVIDRYSSASLNIQEAYRGKIPSSEERNKQIITT